MGRDTTAVGTEKEIEKSRKKCLTKPASSVNISELSARAVHSGKSSQKSGKTSKTLKKVLDKLSFL